MSEAEIRPESGEAGFSSAEPGAAAPSAGSRWSAFRQGLERRRDAEHAFALVRVLFLALWLIYCVASETSVLDSLRRPVALLTVLALAGAVWLLSRVGRDPKVAPRRRLAAAALDQLFICITLLLIGDRGAWLLPVSIIVSVANGLHFGRSYGLFAALLATAGFALALWLRPDMWPYASTLAKATAVGLLAIPAYVALVGERLMSAGEKLRERTREMTRLAMEDPLTHVADRGYFKRCLARAIDAAKKSDGDESFAVLCCDLDDFKMINDAHGQQVGDALLQEVSICLRKCVRGTDVVARLGGDEFGVYLRGINDADIAKRIARSIVAAVRAIDSVDSTAVQISCSVGITVVAAPVEDAVTADRVLARAGEAMSQAKRAGKNQFYLQWANL